MHTPFKLLLRSLEPIYSARWIFLYVLTAALGGLWWAGSEGIETLPPGATRNALAAVVHSADAIWLIVAAINLHFHLAETEGARRARFIAAMVIATTMLAAFLSLRTSYPFGARLFTDHFGPRLGPIPFGWPLLWLVIVVSGRSLAARLLPTARPPTLAAATGLLAVLTDLNLEPIATELRLYWFWIVPGTPIATAAPWRNFATWFVLGTALAWLMRDFRLASSRRAPVAAAGVLVLFNALLLLGHLRLAMAR